MVYSGNPDQDIILSLPSSPAITDAGDLFHQPDPLQATTYLIAAERALHHLEYNLPQIHKIFSVFHIPQSDYGVHAGFDEGFMRADLGFLEQIHVFIRSEVHDMPSLLSGLGSIFAPFPAVLFTETSFYDIPVSKVADNAAGSNELVHFSKFINNGTDAHTQPIAICLTRTSESNSPKGFGSGTESNHQNSGNNNKRSTDKQEELDEDEPSNCNKNGVGQGCLASEPSGREGNQANWKADITWDVISEICSSQPGEPRVVSQRLGTKGKVMIERTPEVVEPKQFATCKVHFTDLRFRIDQLTNKMNYGHFYTTVNINSLQKNADIAYFEPKRTLKFTGHSKVMSASKTGLNNTASGTVAAAIAPQPTFGATLGANIAQTRETTTGTEKSTDTSQISVKDMYGAIEWGLCFADPYETKGGMVLNVDDLPRVDFTFVGDKDIPAPQQLSTNAKSLNSAEVYKDECVPAFPFPLLMHSLR